MCVCMCVCVGDSSATVSGDQLMGEDPETQPASAIWCLTVRDGLIVAGCGNGRIEVCTVLSAPVFVIHLGLRTAHGVQPQLCSWDYASVKGRSAGVMQM